MIKPLYSIRDIKAGFVNIFTDINDAVAKRNFSHAVNSPDTTFYSNPEDYALFKVGAYDDEAGIIVPCDKELIAEASQVIVKE